MSLHWLVVLSPIAALMCNVFAEILAGWFFATTKKAIVSGLCFGFIMNIYLLLVLQQNQITVSIEDSVINLFTYLALSFCFWAFLNLNITSIRIRIIRELLISHDGLERTRLAFQYSPQEAFNRRIERLAASKHITHEKNRFRLQSRKFLPFVIVSNTLRNIIISRARKD